MSETASEIIKRLRRNTLPSQLVTRALDQELVRIELERLMTERDALKAHVENLRTALQPFAAMVHEDGIDAPYPEERWVPLLVGAKEALAPRPTPEKEE